MFLYTAFLLLQLLLLLLSMLLPLLFVLLLLLQQQQLLLLLLIIIIIIIIIIITPSFWYQTHRHVQTVFVIIEYYKESWVRLASKTSSIKIAPRQSIRHWLGISSRICKYDLWADTYKVEYCQTNLNLFFSFRWGIKDNILSNIIIWKLVSYISRIGLFYSFGSKRRHL